MPALNSVVFTSTHADGRAPVANSDGTWTLKFPANAELCTGKTCTSINMHQTVSIPVGFVGLISGNTATPLAGTTGGGVNSQILPGLGTPEELKLQVMNLAAAGTGNFTPTVNTTAAELIVVKQDEFSIDDTVGTW